MVTALPHTLIKETLAELIEHTFNRINHLICLKHYLWSRHKMCDAFHYLLDNIFTQLSSQCFRQSGCIPMSTYSAAIVADLLLFCYERDFMLSLSDNTRIKL